jgi:hypothetical protein
MKKYTVTLTIEERNALRELIAAGKAAAQKLIQARLLLKADAAPGGRPGPMLASPKRWKSIAKLQQEIEAWGLERNEQEVEIKWQFTTADARIKLHRLYP